jgi:hypothetical protein
MDGFLDKLSEEIVLRGFVNLAGLTLVAVGIIDLLIPHCALAEAR